MGIDALGEQESPLEIEIVDPEEVTIGMDGLEITLKPGEDDGEEGFSDNLAEYIKSGALQSLAGDLVSDIDNDKNGRKDWEKTYVDGLKLLGLPAALAALVATFKAMATACFCGLPDFISFEMFFPMDLLE